MNSKFLIASSAILGLLLGSSPIFPVAQPAIAQTSKKPKNQNEINKVKSAMEVLKQMTEGDKKNIPASLIRRSRGIAIIPNIAQGAFIIGARRGKGIMVMRNADGSWGNPAFFSVTGGSIGLQVGGQSTDMILLLQTTRAVEAMKDGNFDFGGSVSGAAGPLSEGAVDSLEKESDIYTYSRSKGLFGSVSVEGTELDFNKGNNEDFYNRPDITPQEIFNNPNLSAPAIVGQLRQALRRAERR